MERMTKRIDGKAVLKECTGACMICNEAVCRMNIFSMMSRLAIYEDIGTPEEINRIIDSYGRGLTLRTDVSERVRIIKRISTKRLMELAQAEKDGRLVVLDEPRKPLVWGDDEHNSVLCPNCGAKMDAKG